MSANTSWDETVDLLVVGSGAGAMTAAITAAERGGKVLVIEKSDRYGGNSAMSGGGLWVPNNHLMEGVGIKDSPEDAWTYLKGPVDAAPEDPAGVSRTRAARGQVSDRARAGEVRFPAGVC